MPRSSRLLPNVASLAAAALVCGASAAQEFPSKAIRYVVPFAPGGGVDTLARVTGAKLNTALGQAVVVENRPGGNGILGAELVARAAPDGHTLLITSNSHTYNASLYPKLPYDPFRDFIAVGYVASGPNMLVVHPSLPVRSVKDLLVLARARPKQLTYSSGGIGGGSHLAGELFAALGKVDILHVPYKGIAPAVSELVGGHVSMAFAVVPTVLGHTQAGKLRALAVTSAERSSLLPELPTVAESGLKGFDVFNWYGVFAPANTPGAAVSRVNAELNRIGQMADVKPRLATLGLEVRGGSAEEFGRFLRADWTSWDRIIRELNIRAE
jgi:tripartite-type tricarboxylate transporter receptor subunit TctC